MTHRVRKRPHRFAIEPDTANQPSSTPVDRDEMKLALKVNYDEEDTLIDSYIAAATAMAEKVTRRALIRQGFVMHMDCFPNRWIGELANYRTIKVWRPPLISVTSIDYIDEAGASQTVPSADYKVDTKSAPARIVLNDDKAWPDIDNVPNAVTITYLAGYGDGRLDVPEPIRQAIRLMVAHFYENRESTVIGPGLVVTETPQGWDALLAPYRVVEFM